MVISAAELQTQGISLIEASLHNNPEAVVALQGENRYIVMNMERYHHMRECELLAAYHETMRDIKNGDYVIESSEEHMKRISKI